MLHQISSNAFASLDAESRKIELDALVDQTKLSNGSASAYLRSRIEGYEEQFDLSSEELLAQLSNGEIEETEDVASWLFYIEAYRAHGG